MAQIQELQTLQVGQLRWQMVPAHVENQQQQELTQGWKDSAVHVHVGKIQGRDSAINAARNAGPVTNGGSGGPTVWPHI